MIVLCSAKLLGGTVKSLIGSSQLKLFGIVKLSKLVGSLLSFVEVIVD